MLKIIIVVYQWLIALPIASALTGITAVATIIGSFCFGSHFWGYYPGMIWSKTICLLTGQRVKVYGREHIKKGNSYIFAPNHQGTFDIFLIYGHIGVVFNWVMKQELRKAPFIGSACEYAGHIYIDRSSPGSIKKSIMEAKDRLQKGNSVVIFPEGSRTETGKLGRFKKGAFMIATDIHLPIVPITIDGSFTTFTKGRWFVKPNTLKLTFHEPIETVGMTEADIPELMKRTRSVIARSLGEESI